MTFQPVSSGVNAIPSNIIDAVELNERFTDLRDVFGVSSYYGEGWIPVAPSGGFEFHSSTSIKTISDINLTSNLKAGDKITWTHTPTGGDSFGYISVINHNSTVVNRTYIEIIGSPVLNETVVANTVGISRIASPMGFPIEASFGEILYTFPVSDISTLSQTFVQMGNVQITVPAGNWLIECIGSGGIRQANASTADVVGYMGLSTSPTVLNYEDTFQFYRLRTGSSSTETRFFGPFSMKTNRVITSSTIVRLVGRAGNADTNLFAGFSINPANTGVLRARPNYR
jgi:hypothetical protein